MSLGSVQPLSYGSRNVSPLQPSKWLAIKMACFPQHRHEDIRSMSTTQFTLSKIEFRSYSYMFFSCQNKFTVSIENSDR